MLCRYFWPLILLAFPLQSWGGQGFVLKSVREDSEAVARYLRAVEDRLPPLLKEKLSYPIEVGFDDISENELGIYQVGSHRITLSTRLLEGIRLGPEKAFPVEGNHRMSDRKAMAVLIHELGHLFDMVQENGPVSSSSEFRQVSGIANATDTTLMERTADPYELKNERERFAVNLEYFLLDPTYACRRPGLYQYWVNLFGWKPFEPTGCQLNTRVRLHVESWENALEYPQTDLNPDRVYAIHYLMATRGPGAMSAWGHAMFRIILCAPSRTEVGPECVHDVSDHVVITYRAEVADGEINSAAGLIGDYPSRLYLRPFSKVVEEYTRQEFRNLVSLPIEMSREEISSFIHHTLEAYWTYKGKYYFLNNNCATESVNLLVRALPPDEHLDRIPVLITPKMLYAALARSGRVRVSLLQSVLQAQRDGYWFGSEEPRYRRAFTEIQKYAYEQKIDFDVDSFRDWVQDTTAEQRYQMYESFKSRRVPKTIVAQMLLLEGYLQTEQDKTVNGAVNQWMAIHTLPDAIKRAGQFHRWVLQQLKPWSQAHQGYGIPLLSEMAKPRSLESRVVEDLERATQEWLYSNFKKEMDEAKRIEQNRLEMRRLLLAKEK